MINGHKTKREIEMEKRTKKLGEWEAQVVNIQEVVDEDKVRTVTITTPYFSRKGDTLDSIAHKIKLDLMTNLKYGFDNPIKVMIKKDDDKIKVADEINIMEKEK